MTFVNSIIESLLTIDIITIPLGIVAAVVFAVQANKTQDIKIKKRAKSWMWWTLFGPIALLVLLIIIYGLIILMFNTLK